MLTRQQLVRQASQRVDIVARIRAPALKLLTAGIGWRRLTVVTARRELGNPGLARAHDAAAKIKHAHVAVTSNHDVVRLEVRMHHATRMRMRNGATDVADDGERVAARQRAAGALEQLAKPLALEELHRIKR